MKSASNRLVPAFAAILTMAVILALAAGLGRPASPATSDDHDAVLAANDAFFKALNAMLLGDPKPLEDAFWHSDDLIYLGADGGFNVGWEQTYANWKEQAAVRIGGTVSVSDVRVVLGEDMAMTSQWVRGSDQPGHGGPVKLRSTSVMKKRGDTWKMICHHVDVISSLHREMAGDHGHDEHGHDDDHGHDGGDHDGHAHH